MLRFIELDYSSSYLGASFSLSLSLFLVTFLIPCLSLCYATYTTCHPYQAFGRFTFISTHLSVSFSRYISAYWLPVSNFTTVTVAKLAVFVRCPVLRFSFHTLHLRRDGARRFALTTMLFRCASSSIVNVFLLLHPSMPNRCSSFH